MNTSSDGTFTMPERVRLTVEQSGTNARQWLETLPALVATLEEKWHIQIGAPIAGGSGAFVAPVQTANGGNAIIKLNLSGDGFAEEIGTLVRAEGCGYARVLNYDLSRDALLLEALGPSLDALTLPSEQKITLLCQTLHSAWQVLPEAAQPVQNKAQGLHRLITELWDALGQPCSRAVVDQALIYAERRSGALIAERCVLVHGDPHPANLLQVPIPRAGAESGFVFVDPDGFVCEPEYDLGVILRDWCSELLAAPNPLRMARHYCALLAQETGLSENTIWEWGFIERVSTGLYISAYGSPKLGEPFFQTASLLLD